ncbi:MAG: ketopantoate reductase family protein [Anaerolineales bacterium]|nr:ketopantoate reductase family protein [Anaerolineales bacterium]
MRALIIGGGAIGTLAATALGTAGFEIIAVARPATAQALIEHGYRLTGPEMEQVIRPRLVTGDWAQALETQPDVMVVAVKTYDTGGLLAEIRPVLGKHLPAVLCLQNGLDNEAALGKVFGVERVLSGTVTTAVGLRGPGDAVVERARGVGLADGHALSGPLAGAFTAGGHRVARYADAGAMKWSKLLTNLIGNATSALLDWPVVRIYRHGGVYSIERRMLREALAVMRALGLPVVDLPGVRVRLIPPVLALPAWLGRPLLGRAAGGGRGAKMPSFHVDVFSGKPLTEVAWLNGAVARSAARVKLQAPVNVALTTALNAATAGQSFALAFRNDPQGLLAYINRG